MELIILNKDSKEQLMKYLDEVQFDFSPPLFDRLQNRSNVESLEKYVDKVLEYGVIISYKRKDEIYGIIVLYNNDFENKEAYIPLLSVKKKMSGKGLAKSLIQYSIKVAVQNGMKSIKVKTWKTNIQAIYLYRSQGFHSLESDEDITFIKKI